MSYAYLSSSVSMDMTDLDEVNSLKVTITKLIYHNICGSWELCQPVGCSRTRTSTSPLCPSWSATCASVSADNLLRTWTFVSEQSARFTHKHCSVNIFFSESLSDISFLSLLTHPGAYSVKAGDNRLSFIERYGSSLPGCRSAPFVWLCRPDDV